MKGGRTAPRNSFFGCRPDHSPLASMKGGRTAPRNLDRTTLSGDILGFNEGGADCPPKLFIHTSIRRLPSELQ